MVVVWQASLRLPVEAGLWRMPGLGRGNQLPADTARYPTATRVPPLFAAWPFRVAVAATIPALQRYDSPPRSWPLIHMRNPLQEQLLKAGLVKKSKVAQVAHEQTKARHGKAPPAPSAEQREIERLRAERVERDRALSAERNAQAQANEQRAQARQIIQTQRVRQEGDIEYRFNEGGTLRSVLVNTVLRTQLANGSLVIARLGEGYALLPRAAALKVKERDASMIVLDHASTDTPQAQAGTDDAFYDQFKVPDDLIW